MQLPYKFLFNLYPQPAGDDDHNSEMHKCFISIIHNHLEWLTQEKLLNQNKVQCKNYTYPGRHGVFLFVFPTKHAQNLGLRLGKISYTTSSKLQLSTSRMLSPICTINNNDSNFHCFSILLGIYLPNR